MTRPTFLSLFSGIGGLDLGLERAGWSCVGQVEIDPFCRRVLAKHWPDVPRWGDIREVNPDDLPRADLIAGGFPCQPVSTAGKRRAQADERWLWPEFARIVRHLRPGWVLVENVPGLLVRGMGDVVGDLAACGYDAEWGCIPASAVGAPHRRDRIWVVAYPASPRRTTGPSGAGGQIRDRTRRAGPRGLGGDVPDPECQQLRDEPGRRDGQGRAGAAVAGDDGAAWALADTDSQGKPQPGGSISQERRWAGDGGQPLVDADGEARGFPAGAAVAGAGGGTLPAGPPEPGRRGGDVADPDGAGRWQGSRLGWPRPAPERDGWWAAEPDVGRSPDGAAAWLDGSWERDLPRTTRGVPDRLNRLSALGNAVVPQVAELLGRWILDAQRKDQDATHLA